MFRKGLRRLTLGALLVASVAALVAATGGSAGTTPFAYSTQEFPSTDGTNACPGFGINERHYCLVVTTFNGLQKGGAVEVDLRMENYDQSTLTNPKATLTWSNDTAKLSFLSSNPANCSSASAGTVTCSFPNIPGVGSASGPGVTPVTSSVKLYFASATDSATTISLVGAGTAKENGNDNTSASNVETQTSNAVLTLDDNSGVSANEDATVVLPKTGFNKPHLIAALGNSSLDLSSGSAPFIAQFAAGGGPTSCFGGVACTGRLLTTDLSGADPGTFSSGNPILWTTDVTASNANNIFAVHYYDPVSITATTPNSLSTAGTTFANCDGVNFVTAPTGLRAGVDYNVVNPTTNASSTTFSVSTSAKGKPISFTQSGTFSGSCIRIIGNDSSEKVKTCTPTSAGPAPSSVPALCAARLNNTTVRVYIWDSANGHFNL